MSAAAMAAPEPEPRKGISQLKEELGLHSVPDAEILEVQRTFECVHMQFFETSVYYISGYAVAVWPHPFTVSAPPR